MLYKGIETQKKKKKKLKGYKQSMPLQSKNY